MRRLDELIAQAPTFAGMRAADIGLIAGCGRNVHFEAGEYLFREGESANSFFLIRDGAVALELLVPGRDPLVVETLREGEIVGWSWLFEPYRWHLDARAVEPLPAVEFDGACLRAKCDGDHELGYQLMHRFANAMVKRLQATRFQLIDVYGRPARA